MLSGYELYVFFLCLVVFVLLTVVSVVMLTTIVKLIVRLIRGGQEDESIKKEFIKAQKRGREGSGVADKVFTLLFSVIFLVLFVFCVFVNVQKQVTFDKIPTMKVVLSESMQKKHANNGYLQENNLNDQFDKFSLILVYKMPEEEELKLYDIVVYEYEGTEIIHRIVKIETDATTGEKRYTFQGDNVKYPDSQRVKYSQMLAIYRGENIPYVGSFVSFMQSPAGWLCILLIVIAFIATPLIEKKIKNEREKRLRALQNGMGGIVINGNGRYVTPHYTLDVHLVTEEPEFIRRARCANCQQTQQQSAKKKSR